ncbi:MAG: nucleotide sugar dehydrogenase [Candidatus Hydrogenedentes bacterium]|nr:nucleotide sugar dehydrogenase [Candidatus Hydrogenedentota bacterium]
MANELLNRISDKSVTVGIIGLGYVGLPLIQALVTKGYRALGFDIDPKKVESLQAGKSYIKHIPDAWLQDWIASGLFSATADMARLGEADAVLICVPTPLKKDRDPDLSYVESTCESIARALRPGQLVVLESTTYPGTTRDIMLPILETSGLKAGTDFYLAYSPEREDPGNPNFQANSIPKVVGGYDAQSLEAAVALYRQVIVQVVPVSSCEVAEAAKILENTYRSVNIAMVNELKVILTRLGVDVWEVIDAAKTKPFGFQAFYPGPGLGGHCIPIDPFYLSYVARTAGVNTRFIELAGEINTSMPEYVVNIVANALNEKSKPIRGSKICLLGAAYKKDVDDPRESPSFEIMERLIEKGADLTYSDPHIPAIPKTRSWPSLPALESQELTPAFLKSLDCAIIVTDHSAFDYAAILEHAPLIVDTRNALGGLPDPDGKVCKA